MAEGLSNLVNCHSNTWIVGCTCKHRTREVEKSGPQSPAEPESSSVLLKHSRIDNFDEDSIGFMQTGKPSIPFQFQPMSLLRFYMGCAGGCWEYLWAFAQHSTRFWTSCKTIGMFWSSHQLNVVSGLEADFWICVALKSFCMQPRCPSTVKVQAVFCIQCQRDSLPVNDHDY